MNRNIILIGMKSSGKTTIGRLLARKLGLRFTDVDAEIERLHAEQKGERLPFREIFKLYGKDYFRTLETAALRTLAVNLSPPALSSPSPHTTRGERAGERGDGFRDAPGEIAPTTPPSPAPHRTPFVLATGGGLPLAEENRPLLKALGIIVFLDVAPEVLLPRITARGIPAFFPYPEEPAKSLAELLAARNPVYAALARITVPCRLESQDTIADMIIHQLENLPHEN